MGIRFSFSIILNGRRICVVQSLRRGGRGEELRDGEQEGDIYTIGITVHTWVNSSNAWIWHQNCPLHPSTKHSSFVYNLDFTRIQ